MYRLRRDGKCGCGGIRADRGIGPVGGDIAVANQVGNVSAIDLDLDIFAVGQVSPVGNFIKGNRNNLLRAIQLDGGIGSGNLGLASGCGIVVVINRPIAECLGRGREQDLIGGNRYRIVSVGDILRGDRNCGAGRLLAHCRAVIFIRHQAIAHQVGNCIRAE